MPILYFICAPEQVTLIVRLSLVT